MVLIKLNHEYCHRNAKQTTFSNPGWTKGVAAIAVVTFHFMEIAVPNPNNNFIAHAYLAVDFFFCLSGFVIAYAYDDKIANIGIGNFLKRRLIRLHPLVVIGSVIGLLTFIFDPFSNLIQSYTGKIVLMFALSCLLNLFTQNILV